jgi:uncharacterized protein YjbJ (UPF0337 family)
LPRVDEKFNLSTTGNIMTINKDQISGRAEEAKGAVKQTVGKAVGNKELEARGSIQKSLGSVQAIIGDAKSDIAKVVQAP